jgi:CheY-like chemotaxis protein
MPASRTLNTHQAVNVLVAEDNPHHQILTLRLLSSLGLRADLVEDGVSVLGAIKRKRYHLLLLDLNMPLMDGFEVARSIVKTHSRTHRPIMVAVTARTESDARRKCLEAGMDEYLQKPITLEDLRTTLGGFGFVAREQAVAYLPATAQEGIPLEMHNRLDLLVSETDPEFVGELIERFIEQGRPQVSEIDRALRSRDWESLKATAHSFKGASRNLGAGELAGLLEQLERVGETRREDETLDPEKVRTLFSTAVKQLRRYRVRS